MNKSGDAVTQKIVDDFNRGKPAPAPVPGTCPAFCGIGGLADGFQDRTAGMTPAAKLGSFPDQMSGTEHAAYRRKANVAESKPAKNEIPPYFSNHKS